MPLTIAPIAVATMGFVTSLAGAGAIDPLCVATNGWICAPSIDPGTIICVEINNSGHTDFLIADHIKDAVIEPVLFSANIADAVHDVLFESEATIVQVASSFTDVVFEDESTGAEVEGFTEAEVDGETEADVDGETEADVDSGDTDFDPQGHC